METRINITETQLPTLVDALRKSLPSCAGATVLALHGDLGVGKTTLVQQIAYGLGVTAVVNSPTFVLQKIYSTDNARFATLVHLDLYRLETPEELAVLQLECWVNDPNTLLCVEWPERVKEWPEGVCVYEVFLSELSATERSFTFTNLSLPSLV